MTPKQQVLKLVQDLDAEASFDLVIEKIYLLKKLERAVQQADRGEGIEHDAFMKQLEAEWEAPASSGRRKRGKTSKGSHATSATTRRGQPEHSSAR